MMNPSRRFLVACAALVGCLALSTQSHAQVPLINSYTGSLGYGTECLSPNDDGSSAPIDLTVAFPNGLHFFTQVHTTAYVNTNGNITFSGPVSTYTPRSFPVANQPMIAPYWGDVDIRYVNGSCQGSVGVTCNPCTPCHNPSENGVWWYLEPGLMAVTWDRVGYYSCHNNLRMSFQLILTEAGCGGAGDFDVEFRYNRCEWESGDASDGSGGFGGTEAQAGFDAGNQTDYVAIPGSMAPGIANTLCTSSNVGQPGIWRFQIRSGSIICPDAGQPCDTGQLGVCAQGRTQCVGSGTQCVADITPSPEECDALDNDCDGQVDEEDEGPLCPTGAVCAAGRCAYSCVEFCGNGQVCDPNTHLCVEPGCVGVMCPEGQRCAAGGVCVAACDGIVCPYPQTCLAGNCVDLCQNTTCDDCTVCEEGVCVSRCEYADCPPGQTCEPDGHCVPDACAGVDCSFPTHCVNGQCVDNCDGANCPPGQMCEGGACVDIPPGLDAGPTYPDGGILTDAYVPPQTDAATPVADAGDDGGSTGPRSAGACANCSTAGRGSLPALGLFWVGLLIWIRRRGHRDGALRGRRHSTR